jgi:molecular chaperone HtpG
MPKEDLNIEIGKYTLESLTTGMYSDPFIIYREYVQNSVDSLEEAVESGLLEKSSMRIDIIVDEAGKRISIRDNGTGIPSANATATLVNIGNSRKRHVNNRGFRGIGRLGGMSYCDELIFQTSSFGEVTASIVTFDCARLRVLLVPGENEHYDLADVLSEVTTSRTIDEDISMHYFHVVLNRVSDVSGLLDYNEARLYISQVAPLPYRTKYFNRATDVHQFIESLGYQIDEFPVFIGKSELSLEPIYKPNRHRYHSDRNKMKNDEILNIQFIKVEENGILYAAGWYAEGYWWGTISENELSGIRVRKGNILIGDNKTITPIFKEQRFNGWVQGELFVLSDKLIPNARRDDFETNDAYSKLIAILSNTIGQEIPRIIREMSLCRNDNSQKILVEVQQTIREAEKQLDEGFNSGFDKVKTIDEVKDATNKLKGIRDKKNDAAELKADLSQRLVEIEEDIQDSTNFKIRNINPGILDRKSRRIMEIVSGVLSEKLAKYLVDEILDEVIEQLNKK